MTLQIILSAIGGLGLFILGMNMLSEGLQKAAGDKLRRFLEILTFNRYIAVLTGIIITVLIQSSSATTVMVVGFVNAGLMDLTRAVGTILGSNIGTTITGQIVAFKLNQIALPAVALGVFMTLFLKKRFYRNLGQAILGFGLLFLGITIMGSDLGNLKDYPAAIEMLTTLGQHRILGLFAGILFTALVQSSSATTAMVIVLVGEGVLDLNSAMPIILGSNIGTCITALLASIGTGLSARRAAVAHVLFNVIGVVLFMFFLQPYTNFVSSLTPKVARQVAWGHTLFNVTNTILFLPFISYYVKLITWLVPGEEEIFETGPKYLDRRMLHTPSFALGAAEREIERMADLALEMVDDSMALLFTDDVSLLRNIQRKEDLIDDLEKEITIYLADLAQQAITQDQSRLVASYLHAINDIERIGDHADNISALVKEKIEDNLPFSESALEELREMYSKVRNMTAKSIAAFRAKNKILAREILIADNEIDRMEKKLRQRHVGRINEGRCFPPSGVLYLDILSNFERIGDHATNIAQVVLGDF